MNLEKLEKYHTEGWLQKQNHPSLPLVIWNYSPKTQYEAKWDDITLQCRGLVTDNDGNIVARPFRKFFNMEEGKHTPTSDFDVYEKMDGSLGIFFYYKNNPVFASRGSFTSEQAVKGRSLLEKYNWDSGTYSGHTYLFEIIYPENRIVVDYGEEEKLVLLGIIETATGRECSYDEMITEGFDVVKKYDGISDYQSLKKIIKNNAEGFVIRFSNGDRMKIKGEEYVRLHRIMTDLTTRSVWEVLHSGKTIDSILEDVPDEFYHKIKSYENELVIQFSEIKETYIKIYNTIKSNKDTNDRKVFARYAKQYKYPRILFMMEDNKDYTSVIWDLIYPDFKKL